jgi:hypothetical protein
MSKFKELTRQELYDLVWSTPIVRHAKEFGLSDVGLRKTCVRYQVPTPPPGYWAKLNFGKAVKKLEAHLGNVLIGMLTGAATVRHNRIAAEAEKRR